MRKYKDLSRSEKDMADQLTAMQIDIQGRLRNLQEILYRPQTAEVAKKVLSKKRLWRRLARRFGEAVLMDGDTLYCYEISPQLGHAAVLDLLNRIKLTARAHRRLKKAYDAWKAAK